MNKSNIDGNNNISPLLINRLSGRLLKIPATKKSAKGEILLIYGHHSSLERMNSTAQYLANFGRVTVPDLPGLGGMDSFYKLGEKPTMDNFADYLATFIKLNYKNRHLVIIGMSFGFAVVTKMLQKYPELSKQVDAAVSLVGFTNCKDFKLKKRTMRLFRYGGSIFSNRLPAAFLKYVILRKLPITLTYLIIDRNNPKFKDADATELLKRIAFEVILWKRNDIRTYMDATVSMMKLDLSGQQVDVPLVNLTAAEDRYFDPKIVLNNLEKIYRNIETHKLAMPNHAPTVVGSSKEIRQYFNKEIRQVFKNYL